MRSPQPARQAAFHAIVRGRVQGVGFRFFVERRARQLGLSGWVRNREDGESVELFTEGDPDRLEMLREALGQGPAHSRVEAIDLTPALPQELSGFEVRF